MDRRELEGLSYDALVAELRRRLEAKEAADKLKEAREEAARLQAEKEAAQPAEPAPVPPDPVLHDHYQGHHLIFS